MKGFDAPTVVNSHQQFEQRLWIYAKLSMVYTRADHLIPGLIFL